MHVVALHGRQAVNSARLPACHRVARMGSGLGAGRSCGRPALSPCRMSPAAPAGRVTVSRVHVASPVAGPRRPLAGMAAPRIRLCNSNTGGGGLRAGGSRPRKSAPPTRSTSPRRHPPKKFGPTKKSLAQEYFGGLAVGIAGLLAAQTAIGFPACFPFLLDGRTWDVAVGAEDATIAGLGPQDRPAAFAVEEKLASVRRHGFGRLMPTGRTGDR